jgi:hypothetical protein
MKVLIACERSGVVRNAFAALGHDAWSCDLEDAPGQHIRGDAREVLCDGWDLLVAHPPCQFLSVSGMHWTVRGVRPWSATHDALDFFARMLLAPIDRICVENPISVASSWIREPDQIVQPYEFGDDASKATAFWLKNLPRLRIDAAKRIDGRMVRDADGVLRERWSNQTDSGQNKLGPSEDRAAERAQTYPGIAAAMALQWGGAQQALRLVGVD